MLSMVVFENRCSTDFKIPHACHAQVCDFGLSKSLIPVTAHGQMDLEMASNNGGPMDNATYKMTGETGAGGRSF